jgi:hypothetical protein
MGGYFFVPIPLFAGILLLSHKPPTIMVLLLLLASLMVFAITIVAIVGLLLAYRQPPEPQRFDDLSDFDLLEPWEFADRN